MSSSESEPQPLLGIVTRLIQRSIGGALRSVVSLVCSDIEVRGRRFVRGALASLAMTVIGVTGALFMAVGLARLLERWIAPDAPGIGHLIIGAALLVGVLVAVLAGRGSSKA